MIDVRFNGCGYILDDVPKNIFEIIKKESSRAKRKAISFSTGLAGNIEEEYSINFENQSEYDEFEGYLLSLITEFDNRFNYIQNIKILNKNLPYRLNAIWANYQKKYEFNPYHDHYGLFSFVIWVKVPYLIEDEISIPSVRNSNLKAAGNFSFIYPSLYRIENHNIPADKTYEGKIILFPSNLGHLVYPFYTSDDYRISVSGNINLIVPD